MTEYPIACSIAIAGLTRDFTIHAIVTEAGVRCLGDNIQNEIVDCIIGRPGCAGVAIADFAYVPVGSPFITLHEQRSTISAVAISWNEVLCTTHPMLLLYRRGNVLEKYAAPKILPSLNYILLFHGCCLATLVIEVINIE